jgi:hypothetical protein
LASLVPGGGLTATGSRYAIPFASSPPSRWLDVAPGGDDTTADGGTEHPFKTIRAAFAAAIPGTAVRVASGTYEENVTLDHSGERGAPIWLIGTGLPKLVPRDKTTSTLQGYGVHDLVLQGFDVTAPAPAMGDSDAIKFAASGDVSVTSNLNDDLAVVDCTVHTDVAAGYNGIKISGSDHVFIIHDSLDGAGGPASGDALDFVGNTNCEIGWTFATNVPGHAAFQVKGGSTTVLFHDNLVRDVGGDGLWIGGGTIEQYMRPSSAYEACNVTARDLVMHELGNGAVHFVGGQGSAVTHLFAWDAGNAYVLAEASTDTHSPAIASRGDSVLDSVFKASSGVLGGAQKDAVQVSMASDVVVTEHSSVAGNDVFDGGALITSGGGHDVYALTAGGGPTLIIGFQPASDVVRLSGYTQQSFGALVDVAHQVGPDVFVDLSDGELLVLEDVQLAALGCANFSF